VREVFRATRRDHGPAQDILVIARTGADKLQYREVAAELGPVFRAGRVAS
jgi:RNase P protein component